MKTKILSLLAIIALLFVSCNDDDNTPEANDGMVKFSSGLSGLQTKVGGADGDEWTQGDSIGIYMRKIEIDTTTVSWNVKYRATALSNTNKTATFTSTAPIYYPSSLTKVDFVAYHPYRSLLTSNYFYVVNVSDQTNQSAIDLMAAMANNGKMGYDKTNTSAINLQFHHQLAKVILNVTNEDGVGSLTGLAVSIKGMNSTANFYIAEATLGNKKDVVNITPYNAGNNRYEAILLPGQFTTSHVVEFTVGGNTYTWTMSENDGGINQLEAGKKYTFNIALKRNAVSVTGTIDPWSNINGGNGTAH